MSAPPQLPPVARLVDIIFGKFKTQLVGLVARNKIADHVAAAAPGTRAADIASKLKLNPDAVYRILRACTAFGVFAELQDNTFVHNDVSVLLQSGPGSLAGMAMWISLPCHNAAYDVVNMQRSLETGSECWSKAHGDPIWSYAAKNLEMSSVFQSAMTAFSGPTAAAIVAGVDWARFKGKTLCDCGGGYGMLLAACVRAAGEGTRGALVELPYVTEGEENKTRIAADTGDQSANITVITGNIFKEVPAADVYLQKHIWHDWDDEHCVQALKLQKAAMKPGGSVFVFEHIVAAANVPDFAKILDIEMLVVTNGGRERTLEEFEKLFAAAGMKIVKVHQCPGPVQAIEAQ